MASVPDGRGLEGRPAAEVAAALGTTVGTVYYYKSRAIARMRQLVEGFEGDPPGLGPRED